MLNFESSRNRRFILAGVVTVLLTGVSGAESPEVSSAGPSRVMPKSRTLQLGLPVDTPIKLLNERTVPDLDRPIVQMENVFWEPRDTSSLRRLIRETPLVRDKVVLEIGTGTGLLALCCLKAGARKVVATDVNPSAIANAAYNAELLGVDKRLETRWVQIEIKTKHAQNLRRQLTVTFDQFPVAFFAQLLSIRRLAADQAQTRHTTTFLVDCYEGLNLRQIAQIIDQLA